MKRMHFLIVTIMFFDPKKTSFDSKKSLFWVVSWSKKCFLILSSLFWVVLSCFMVKERSKRLSRYVLHGLSQSPFRCKLR